MLNYHITTEAEKKLIAGWAYPRDYAIYDLPSYETQKSSDLDLPIRRIISIRFMTEQNLSGS